MLLFITVSPANSTPTVERAPNLDLHNPEHMDSLMLFHFKAIARA